jgi:CrcB protein
MNETIRQVLLVGMGGFVGSVCRFGMGGLVYRLMPAPVLPYGTLAVNVVGCFVIGLLSAVVDGRGGISPELRWLIFAGFLGGFTTFSAFGYETVTLMREAAHVRAGVNVGLHLMAGLGAVWAGYSLGR